MPFFQNILTEIYKTLKQNNLINYCFFVHKTIRQKDQSQPYYNYIYENIFGKKLLRRIT